MLLSIVSALPEASRAIFSQTKKSVPSNAPVTPGLPTASGRSTLLQSSAAIVGGGALIGASIAALMHSYPAGASKGVHDTFYWDTQKKTPVSVLTPQTYRRGPIQARTVTVNTVR